MVKLLLIYNLSLTETTAIIEDPKVDSEGKSGYVRETDNGTERRGEEK